MGYITTKPTNNMEYIRSWVNGKRDTWLLTEENHQWLRSPRMYRLN